jgi:hypothetical protein
MDSKPSRWVANACQRRDGTLSLGHDCPSVAGVAGRDVLTELKRGVLSRVADMGGIPYWLGASFHGAAPQPRPSRRPYKTIAYALRYGNERVTLRVVTGLWGKAQPPVDGVLVLQVSPKGTPVLVVADRALPAGLSSDVRGALRPFLRDRPYAKQVPGDLGEDPTRIDTSVSVQVWWVGPEYQGRRATVISGAPAGVGLVRYGEPGSPGLFYLASYLPVKRTRCGILCCASSPSLPAELKAYGESTDTIVRRDGWIVEVLAQPGSTPVNASALYQALNLAH